MTASFEDGYRAATDAAAVVDQSDRRRFLVTGRAPGKMLAGVVTGRIPGVGERAYSTVLTPKGRMVSDLWITRLPGEDERFLLDVPSEGEEALTAYFTKVMPPRFAKVTDISDDTACLSIVGPQAARVMAVGLAALAPESPMPHWRDALDALQPEQAISPVREPSDEPLTVAHNSDLDVQALTVILPANRARGLGAAISTAGALEVGERVWETLRVEAGTPRFGADMDDTTIPIEAGIGERAIDDTKGCYTGQEVIVRIKHRGHVNRNLRRLAFSKGASVGDELFTSDNSEKPVGRITSVVESPRDGGPIGLGYVRREVEVGSTLAGGVRVVA